MFEVENVYKSADIVTESNREFTVSELDNVQLVLQESGEIIEGMVTKILVKSIGVKVFGEVGTRRFNYKDDVADIKVLEKDT